MATPRAPGHRMPTSATAHYVDGEGVVLEALIVARRNVDAWTDEVRRRQALLDYSLGDPSQPPEAVRGCREGLRWARARLDRARAALASVEQALDNW